MVGPSLWIATNIQPVIWNLSVFWIRMLRKRAKNLVESLFWALMTICLNWLKRHQIERVIVAIPSLDPSEYERILQMCNKLDVKCYKMPNVETVVQGLHQAGTGFQKIDIIDLLGRQEIRLDESRLGAELTGKTILVTGLVVQSVLKSVAKLVASILNASSCSVMGKTQSTLFIMN